MGELDLFGVVPEGNPEPRPGSRRPTGPGARAYPAMPGTGPEGKCCRDCENYTRTGNGYGLKTFAKCLLMRPMWTHGYGTDIKARSPACSKFVTASDGGGDE